MPGTPLLDRWGTMSFEKVLEQMIELAENESRALTAMARAIATSQKISKEV